ncbi:MAG: hypothetical protein J6J36_04055 [Clostridia bacterium]|nr:hypothetical protein [Clostridia bacterium]
MMECEYKKSNSLAIYRAIISIVLGVGIGVATFFGLVTNITTLLTIIISVAVVAVGWILLSILIDGFAQNKSPCCAGIEAEARDSLIGAIGAIITSTIAFTVGIVASSIVSAILLGVTSIFAIFLIIRIFNLINKLIKEVSNYRE